MSALNAFSRPDGAWLLADTAGYDHWGRILSLSGKCCARPDLRLAIGHAGRVTTDAQGIVFNWVQKQASQSSAVAGLPTLLDELATDERDFSATEGADACGPLPTGIRLVAALWDFDAATGRCFAISTVSDLGPNCPPGTIRPITTMFSPPVRPDPWPGHSFDPARDGERLAELQRRTSPYRVGGTFEAWLVSAEGVERQEVARWPDALGDFIPQPSAEHC